ncbi:broad-complex core protein isoforms 1/2/3/4/5-like isoform X16 [Eriocheir sinensis]|uniref:broad-complex core protein isoforms 1/2/3/4/5-like isoform X16 n=1 Tax=Eriocheir sinensis TaxID=95602 RepID=UPI0021C5CE90|nr:broad-complex core protein isoforms 1/2/3/4/5-like isoform X16 [Eriocheir sinensis]
MGADQQFCLRWNNFHSNITSAFESLRDDEDFVDITLACEGRQIKAHKMVLSACSPYFRSLLKGNPCQHPIVFLKDVTFANLTSILDFMYHGEVNVSHNELATFLKTAEALKVRGLAEDEKKKDAEGYNESSSPPPSRGEPPDPGSSPRPEEGGSAPDTHLSGDSPQPPPSKRQRRRSAASLHSAEDNTSETVLSEGQRDSSASVKNEPQDYPEDEDNMLASSAPATLEPQDLIKADLEDPDDRSFGPSDSVTISRSQAAMQQLQESFGSFLPGMGQAPSGFLPQGATDLPRPPPYPLEGVQGLPPGISALPGPSMSQGASQETGQEWVRCGQCNKVLGGRRSLKQHIACVHAPASPGHQCKYCLKVYKNKHTLFSHVSQYHRYSGTAGAAAASSSSSAPPSSSQHLHTSSSSSSSHPHSHQHLHPSPAQ